MSTVAKDLLDSGIHFGHHASRWNPKMKPYLYGIRNNIHIVDIRETLKGLLRGQRFVSQVVQRGADVLFVGTKRQARDAVQSSAESTGMHYVNERWLGGTLTNFRTIRSRLQRLEELETISTGPAWESKYSKKMQSMLMRELKKIKRNLEGVRRMARLPGVLVVVDARKEHNALREARSLGIPTVCLIDTDSDPDTCDIPIPGNDDAMRAISILMSKIGEAIEEGKRARPARPENDKGDEGAGRGRRRGGEAAPAAQTVETVGGDPAPSAPEASEAEATTSS